MNVFLSHL